MADWLLDASALLAAAQNEPGGEMVAAVLDRAAISAVNALEVMAVLARRLGDQDARERFAMLALPVLPFTEAEAAIAQPLLRAHRGVLSLGDAACLGTALATARPVLTADRAWAGLGLGLDIRLIRPPMQT